MSTRAPPGADELAALLALHKQWVESDGNEGLKANLEDANLEQADLRDVDLTRATLNGARLRGARLDGADLRDTTFFNADLTNAELGKARGLSFHNLAGADLTGAILPAAVDPSAYLARLGEITGNARTTFNSLMIASAYCVLTILTTTDDHLLRNASASPIPFTGTEAPILWFFKLMPFVIMLIFIFFLVNLSRLWTSMKRLPAVFPDGSDLTTIPYAWVLTDVVRAYMPQLQQKAERQRVPYNSLLCYTFFLIPIATLFLFWWQYLPLRDAAVTYSHVVFFSIAVFATIVFIWFLVWKNIPTRSLVIRSVMLGLCVFLIGFVYLFSYRVFRENYDRQIAGCPSGIAVPLLCGLGHRSYVEVRYKTLSIRPLSWADPAELISDDDWADRGKADKIDSLFAPVEGIDLRGFDLSFADAQDAFLVKARLEGTILTRADLKFADLRLAHLDEAQAQGALFSRADLRRARFHGAHLDGAYLDNADLRAANLVQADLTGAWLDGADLRGAFLQEVKAKGVHLKRADLSDARLPRADLTGADLGSAKLRGANLVQSDLRGAILDGADLSGARLDGADLSENDSITEGQLMSACAAADAQPKLPERLAGQRLPGCLVEDPSSGQPDQ